MTTPPWLEAAALTLGALWILGGVLVFRGVRVMGSLRPRAGAPPGPSPGELPLVSVIVALRDEGEHVTAAVGSLLELSYPRYEVVAVNDRSRDDTGPKLEALAARSDRLQVVHVDELPEGWLGKCNALRRGVERARGEWLLFTDGDVRFHPEALRLAVEHAVDRGLDGLSLMPSIGPRGPFMRAFYASAMILTVLLLGLWAGTRRRQSLLASGAGAFILARRSAYEAAGGHESLRLEVVDDISLAMLLRRTGGRTEVTMGIELLEVPWASTFRELFRVTRKNGFAVFGYSWIALGAFSLFVLATSALPHVLFPLIPGLRTAGALVWIGTAACYVAIMPATGIHWLHCLIHPAMVALSLLPAWRSAVAITRDGGVRWRDSFYSLEAIQKARKQRGRSSLASGTSPVYPAPRHEDHTDRPVEARE